MCGTFQEVTRSALVTRPCAELQPGAQGCSEARARSPDFPVRVLSRRLFISGLLVAHVS